MIAAIMNSSMSDWASAILDSDTLLSSLRFTQKHSLSTLTLTQTNSIWLKLIHSHLTWWWQPYCIHSSWILPSWILPSWIQPFSSKTLTPTNSIWLKVIHSDSTWWWQPSWIQPFFTKINFTHSFWLNLMMAVILNSAILDSAILHKKKTFTHSFWLNLNMAAILNSASILNSAILDSAILHKKNLHSFILTQLDDGSNLKFCIHLELCHLGFSHFAQKTSLVHSDSIWWWQSSWTLPCWIQTLPSWIQTPCHLLSDSLKNTPLLLGPWLNLIQSD